MSFDDRNCQYQYAQLCCCAHLDVAVAQSGVRIVSDDFIIEVENDSTGQVGRGKFKEVLCSVRGVPWF